MRQLTNEMKEVIYIDMDGVLCDIEQGFKETKARDLEIEFPQSIPGFFEDLSPIAGAIDAVNELRKMERYAVFILTAPSTRKPLCYTEKRIWVEKHFDYRFTKKLILSPNKSLSKGHYLIDDNTQGKGQESFEGKLIHFGSKTYPNWDTVLKYFKDLGKC